MKQVQRVGARANRYDHTRVPLPDGRWLVTRKGAAELAGRHVDHVRAVTDAQRKRWAAGVREPGEEPIEVLCTVAQRMVLLDVDALTEAVAARRFADWKRRTPLDV